ncbi:unnamed protein product [marine sediment metagenome]|uniref:Uncharacterized protein n=1 Tax=marine sediment metagenome TaxID=412755 RepID=X1FG91_9ZZZZ
MNNNCIEIQYNDIIEKINVRKLRHKKEDNVVNNIKYNKVYCIYNINNIISK